ncbi:MAG: RCC1 domain-containing protein [Oryzihumus sp.]
MTRLSVRAGSTLGGTTVRIIGRGLTHVRSVTFGSTRAHIIATPSSKTMVVASPPHRAGTVGVRVRTASGLSAAVTADHYLYRPPPLQISVGVGGGTTFACARLAVTARCWGANDEGELGNGPTGGGILPPVTVQGLSTGVRDISAGASHTCAVTASHAAKCWGWEYTGQLGNGVDDSNAHVEKPAAVHGLASGVGSIVAGDGDTCAVTIAGVVKCWGQDEEFQLGTNGSPSGLDSAVPVTIAGLPAAKSVAVGGEFACALTRAGGVYCWGFNGDGDLGAGPGPGTTSATPVPVHALAAGVRSLSAGGGTACAVTAARAVKCWGSNVNGVLGVGRTIASSDVPLQVKGLRSGQASVAVGFNDTACAASTTGRAKCWGYNYDGQLGNGNETDSSVPVQVKGVTSGAQDVAVGEYTGCVLTRTGQVMCWGYVQAGRVVTLSDKPVTLSWYR